MKSKEKFINSISYTHTKLTDPDKMTTFKQSEEVNGMLIDAIRAKLALLEKLKS